MLRREFLSYPVVVLGGGYAGLRCVQTLAPRLSKPERVLLIDERPHQELVVQLHEVAAFSTPSDRLKVPHDRVNAGATVRLGHVESIDLDAKRVLLADAEISYRYLVIALGSETAFPTIPGIHEHALPLRWIADAEAIRSRLDAFKSAEASVDRTLVICGAGATGVQLAGEVADWLKQSDTIGTVFLVELENRLLPRFDKRVGQAAARILKRAGVRLLTGRRVQGITADGVTLADGETILSSLVVWAGGIRLPKPVYDLGLPRDGGIVVNPALQLAEYPSVFVIGDAAAIRDKHGNPIPASAQLAVQSGRATGDNLARLLQGQPVQPFKPNVLGEAIAVGRLNAVARVGVAVLTGLPALSIKRFTEQRYLAQTGGIALVQDWDDVVQASKAVVKNQ